MKRLIFFVIVVAAGLLLFGCSTFDYSSSSCPRSSGCNAVIYCGEGGCAGYYGGRCGC